MTKLFNSLKLAVSVFAASAFLFSCTDVDKTLGVNFIPSDEIRSIKIDTIYPDAYTISLDSLSTVNSGLILLGTDYDDIFGSTVAGSAFQMLPVYDTVKFGNSPSLTSLVLTMPVSTMTGDEAVAQTITVYELSERLYIDSSYYPVTPVMTMVNATPVGSVTYNGNGEDIKITLDPSLGNRLLNATDEIMTRADTVTKSPFYDFFKGLYVVAQPVGGSHRMNYVNAGATQLTLTYSNSKATDTTCVYMTDMVMASGAYASVQFNTIQHDYTQANPALRINHMNDTTASAVLDSVVYLQGLYGAAPYIKLKQKMITDWIAKKGLDPKQVAVSRAELVLELEDFSGQDITKYPASLAPPTSWYPYWVGSSFFNWLPSFSGISYYDGTLNRSLKKYSFNLTYEVNRMLQSNTEWKFWLSSYAKTTSYTTTMYNISQYVAYRGVMRGAKHSKPLKLIVTYTEPK